MARKRSGKSQGGSKPKGAGAPGSRINRIENYEDTLEEGGVDDFMFKRDQIMFDQDNGDDDDDVNADEGEEVFALDLPKKRRSRAEDEDFEEDDEEGDDVVPTKKGRKEKKKMDVSGKGRFGKPIEDSDEEDEAEGSGSSDEDDEGWGRQYYSKPSNRRAKEDEDAYDEQREEDREMEEREVKRLQRKAREAFGGEEDWGLEEVPAAETRIETKEKEEPTVSVPVPETTDPAALTRHLEAHEPVKIALARDFPLVVHKLKKTAKGIEEMMIEEEGQESLHKGLGWLHYQTLLTYATTLAFYIHLCALPPDSRPDFSQHPILTRLLQLKEGVGMLEDLDFAAGDRSDVDPLDHREIAEEDEELAELVKAKKELMARMLIASRGGTQIRMPGEDEVALKEDMDDDDEYDEAADREALWHQAGLEDGELDDLLADAEADYSSDEEPSARPKKSKKEKKSKANGRGESDKKKKAKKSKVPMEEETDELDEPAQPQYAFAPLEEPTFVSAQKSKSKGKSTRQDDILGDPTALDDADATDKERRKRSLQFHTSKIASTSARRNAARAQRLGGDEDLPYRDRQAARDAALRKNSQAAVGADLDGSDFTEKDRKRAREVRGEEEDGGDDDGEDYYDLVKRRKTAKEEAKAAAHEEYQEAKFASFEDESHEGGPRSVTRAIEKNRGLTPRRSKTGRNPRVKKRMAYEKAKQKVGSQRAVFKGGQAALGGAYSGEKTGISQKTKSRKF